MQVPPATCLTQHTLPLPSPFLSLQHRGRDGRVHDRFLHHLHRHAAACWEPRHRQRLADGLARAVGVC